MSGTTITTDGTLTGATTGNVTIESGASIATNDFTVSSGSTIFDSGDLYLNSTDTVNAGTPDGVIEIEAAGTVEIGSGFALNDFGEIAFGTAGGKLSLDAGVNYALLADVGNVSNGDNIFLQGVHADQEVFETNGTVTTVSLFEGTTQEATFQLTNVNVAASTLHFSVVDGASGTLLEVLCLCAGTRIATPKGETAVEDLRPGQMVLTAQGEVMPVRWVGITHVATQFADPLRVMPIRIAAGALGDGLPRRDLLVSPDHALFLHGMLVQAAALVDGVNITRESKMPEQFNYYNVELDSHELLLAEGVEVESFVDNVSRTHFHNWDERVTPDTDIVEMAYPRAKSARQVPAALRQALERQVMRRSVA
jgi:hypothetical protein